MQKTALVGNTGLTAINKINEILGADTITYTSLGLVVWMERAIKELEALKNNIRSTANKEFKEICKDRNGEITIEGFAILTKNGARGTWNYPEEVNALIDAAEAAKKEAQTKGTATKTEGKLDPGVSFLFRTKILIV